MKSGVASSVKPPKALNDHRRALLDYFAACEAVDQEEEHRDAEPDGQEDSGAETELVLTQHFCLWATQIFEAMVELCWRGSTNTAMWRHEAKDRERQPETSLEVKFGLFNVHAEPSTELNA